MSAFRARRAGIVGGALLISGCAGLWDPFLAERGPGSDAGAIDSDGGTINPMPPSQGLCPTANICWQNPLPQGNRLASVRAISTSDVWAVGAVGTVLHFDGMAWGLVNSGTTAHLNDLWAYDRQNLWLVGNNSTILRYTPPTFTLDPVGGLGDLYAVRGIDPQKIWAAGTNNAAIKWNGAQWMQVGPGAGITYRGIYPEDVSMAWSCTMGGGIWAWHLQPDIIERNGSNGDLLRLWGTSRNNLFAVGATGQLLRRNTSGMWDPIVTGSNSTLGGMWGPDSSEAWIVGSGGTIL